MIDAHPAAHQAEWEEPRDRYTDRKGSGRTSTSTCTLLEGKTSECPGLATAHRDTEGAVQTRKGSYYYLFQSEEATAQATVLALVEQQPTTAYLLGHNKVSRTASSGFAAANTPVTIHTTHTSSPSSTDSASSSCPAVRSSSASASVNNTAAYALPAVSTSRTSSTVTITNAFGGTSLDLPDSAGYEVQISSSSSQFMVAEEANSSQSAASTPTASTTHIVIMDETSQQPVQQQQQEDGSSPSSSSPSSSSSQQQQQQQTPPLSPLKSAEHHWTRFTQWLHYGICQFVLTFSLKAARNPRSCIALVLLVSVTLAVTGYFTNFYVEADEQKLFSPTTAISLQHGNWLKTVEGFPKARRPLMLMVHANGDNVLTYQAIDRLFQAIDTALALPDVKKLCEHNEEGIAEEGASYCGIHSALAMWDNNRTLFQQETQESDEIVQETVSQNAFPSGKPIVHKFYLGSFESDNNTGLIDSCLTLNGAIELTSVGENDSVTKAVELILLDAMLDLREEWMNEPQNKYHLEFLTVRTIPDELMSTIAKDIPLVPFVFIIMTFFTCLVFFKRDKVQSRCMLGLGSVVTILMSLMSGFGICFIMGKPFTNMTMILPFVIFGVGLDDTFIITGAYFRTNSNKDTVLRIQETMEEVGNSISLTTITTMVAFLLGLISAIPSIQWVCIYASLTIGIDFVYQITFFVAILVLDEERLKANRRDCCVCIVVPLHDDPDSGSGADVDGCDGEKTVSGEGTSRTRFSTEEVSSQSQSETSLNEQPEKKQDIHWADKLMDWYADRLLQPAVKVLVLIGFTAFLGGCIFSATKLEQDFKAVDFLPQDSYALGYLDNTENLAGQTFRIPAYFRFVDQSDPQVQEQMQQYIDDLTDLPLFGEQPEICWFRDFKMAAEGKYEAYANYTWIFEADMTFNERLKFLLSIPEISSIFRGDFALDKDGNIETSRCWFSLPNVDPSDVQDQVQVLAAMQRVARAQPINQGMSAEDFPFFTFEHIFFLWDFYTSAAVELKFTTISGVVAITVVGFLLIPHWSATLFITPLIIVLYADLLGTMQFSGLSVNPLTYVCLVISIGLLVDFLMHVILRYYESSEKTREAKVRDTLRTMGASIFIGGLSTCLGVIPLAFSTSGILKTVFISFIAMVSLGLGHGLILLPVLLSYMGPTVCVRMNHDDLAKELHIEEHHDANQNKVAMTTTDSEAVDVDALAENGATRSFDSDTSSLRQLDMNLPTTNGSEAAAAASILAFMEDVHAAPVSVEWDEGGDEANQVNSVPRSDSMDLIYPSDSISV